MKQNTTNLSDLGKFGLINHLSENITIKNKTSIKGIGDDAAIVNFEKQTALVTTDLLTEGVHFDLVYTPLKHLGYKAVVAGISDIFAMNAIPTQVLVSLAISNKFSVEAIDLLYSGINKACQNYQVDLVGGDTTSSVTGITIAVTAIGIADKEKITTRDNAQIGDLVCVTGNIGAAYAGLQVLKREKEVFAVNPHSQPDLSNYNYVLERQLKPECRKDIVLNLQKYKILPTSMIDVSNGLSSEIIHICKSSGVGIEIYEKNLPIAEGTGLVAQELNMETTLFAMNGGEDYELLFTINPKDSQKLENIKDISVIGKILHKDKEMKLLGRGEGFVTIKSQGWGK